MATESDDTTNVASRQSPRRRRPQRRTSSMYYGPISKALFPSSLTPKLVQQWFQSDGRSKFSSRHHSGYVWPVHDLLANEILLWLLPTHMLTHIIKLVVGLLVLLGCFLWCTLQQPQFYTTLWWVWAAVGLSIPAWIAWYYHTTLYAYGKPWMDPKLPAVNRMEMHVPLRLFQCPQKARRAACLPQLVARRCSTTDDDSDQESSSSYTPNVLLLDDMNWKFQLLPTVEDALMLVYQDNNLHDDEGAVPSEYDWKPIKIPGNWMLQGFNDIPIYTNQKYPFPCQPPVVPRQNPTGVYKLHVSIPEDWCSLEDEDQLSLMLHGIESAAFVFWNGDFLGFFKDSRLPSEFAIPSEFLVDETAVVHIVVVRWSDGSYVEDQDHWWMAGIHRSVELIRRRSGADILDYHVSSPASGNLCVSTHLRESSNNATKRKITARLYSDEQLTAEGDWKKKEEIWSTSKTIPKTATTLQLQGMIPNVQLWTAETPTLYTLVLELQQPSSPEGGDTITDTTTTTTTLQSESCRVGFRTIDVDSGILHVNGKRITICGINRHEHDPDHGKVVSLERMKQDITTLKYVSAAAAAAAFYLFYFELQGSLPSFTFIVLVFSFCFVSC